MLIFYDSHKTERDKENIFSFEFGQALLEVLWYTTVKPLFSKSAAAFVTKLGFIANFMFFLAGP